MAKKHDGEKLDRKTYEKQLRKLQEELCYLQDWVRKTGERVIIILEGRDAAGKGGTIKAITERVSPRVFRVVALPAPSDREKSQMYIQRYVAHFPAGRRNRDLRPQLVQPRWRRVRHGLLHARAAQAFPRARSDRREVHHRQRHTSAEDLAGSRPGGAGEALPRPHRRSHPAMEAEPDGSRIVQAVVRFFQGARSDARPDRHRLMRRGISSIPTTRSGLGSTSSPTSCRKSPTSGWSTRR